MYLVKSPLLLKWYYQKSLWHKKRSEKIVYLTFDDGPIPNVTEFVLNTLQHYGAKATFFCIGDNITKHSTIFERIKRDGHHVGNHTYNHLKGWATKTDEYVANFNKCQLLTQSDLFRPPYGRITRAQIAKLKSQIPQLKIVMWDCLSGDFDLKLTPEKCLLNVTKNVRNGSIIVFHDSLKAWDRLQYALPKTIDFLVEKGYSFGLL